MLFALLAALQFVTIERWIVQLDADSIEARDAAEGQLEKLGAGAVPHLRRAWPESSLERRIRIDRLLLDADLAPHLRDLASSEDDRWERALAELLTADPRVLPALRRAGASNDPLLAFRAAQIADILESATVDGLCFGVVVDHPEARLGSGVPGFEVFINRSTRVMLLELGSDARPEIQGWANCSFGCGGRSPRLRHSVCVSLAAGEARCKRRENLLLARDSYFSSQFFEPLDVGVLCFRLQYWQGEFKSCWRGAIHSNSVAVTFSK